MATFYKGYRIDLLSYKRKSGSWSPWATVALDTGDRITFSQIQSSKITGCKTEREANAQALAVAKAWIDRWTL